MEAQRGILKDNRVVFKDSRAFSTLVKKGYGSKAEGRVELSLIEALYLMDRGWVTVESGGGTVSYSELLSSLDEGELLQYKVYRDLRERGYVAKTGFKFGAHFRVYERGEYPSGGHSRYLVHVLSEDSSFEMPEISRAVRLAQNVRKSLLLAVVDREGDITYYGVERITL